MASSALICKTDPWNDLKAHVHDIEKAHLQELMNDVERCQSMRTIFDGILLDYSRQCATLGTLKKLYNLAEINNTENRSVLHIALRAPREAVINSDDKNVVPDVWQVLDKIKDFSEAIGSGTWVGVTGKVLKDVIAIGIGGSFLRPLFAHTALQTDPEAFEFARGRQLRFLANVDPIDIARNIAGLNPETTLGSLATQVRKQFHASRKKGEPIEGFNFSTTTLLTRYLEASSDVPKEDCTVLPKSHL